MDFSVSERLYALSFLALSGTRNEIRSNGRPYEILDDSRCEGNSTAQYNTYAASIEAETARIKTVISEYSPRA